MILYLDLETYCEVPINHGTHAYAEAAEVMLVQVAVDDDPVQVWEVTPETQGSQFYALSQMIDMADIVVTHTKDGFDRVVLHYQGIDIPLEKHHDTAIQALSHGLPGGLDKLCTIMGVTGDMAKDKAGKQLIQLFCKPRPKTSKIRRATKETHPIEWGRFLSYAGQDIVAMRELYRKLPRVNYPSPREHALWCLDQRINDRGMRVDLGLARGAIATVAAAKKIMDKRTQEITDDQLRSTTQRDQLLQLALADYGVSLPDMQGSTIERRLEDPDLPAGLRELLALRLQTATTSNAKYNRLLKAVSSDGRLRGALQFSGAARTKRWSGKVFQPQNLPCPDLDAAEIDLGIQAIIGGGAHLVWDEPIKLCSNAIRGCIVAEEGKKLVVSDLAQVEARVLCWLAGEQWKIDAYNAFDAGTGPDIYCVTASRATGKDVKKEDPERQSHGKHPELACGYGGAKGALFAIATLFGYDIGAREAMEIINSWRQAHPAIADWDTGLWKRLDDAARNAIQNPGKTFAAGDHIRFERWREWLRMELPSGGFLNYAAPAIMEDPRRPGQTCVSYMGVNNYTKKWERLTTYGGKLSADATQATAREIMAENLPEIEKAGYLPVLLVHDEVVTEVSDDQYHGVEHLNALLAAQPEWAKGLPLAAGGFEAYRYRKDG